MESSHGGKRDKSTAWLDLVQECYWYAYIAKGSCVGELRPLREDCTDLEQLLHMPGSLEVGCSFHKGPKRKIMS